MTKGDEVTALSRDTLLAAAAPIDSAAEAVTALRLANGTVDCDENNLRSESDGFVFRASRRWCSGQVKEYLTKVARDGTVSPVATTVLVPEQTNCVEGRRPAGFVATGVRWLASVEACFAEIAHMEAAAVIAFARLAKDLERHGAPMGLRARVERARRDEVSHARVTNAIARRFGRTPTTPAVAAFDAERGLFDLAIENAVEGCVRETYGALVAAFQGRRAADPGVRKTFARIAEDESEHAELSFALDVWYQSRLSPAEREAVESAKEQAFHQLARECMNEPDPEVVRLAGMPTAREASRLLVGALPYATALLRAAA